MNIGSCSKKYRFQVSGLRRAEAATARNLKPTYTVSELKLH